MTWLSQILFFLGCYSFYFTELIWNSFKKHYSILIMKQIFFNI